MDGFIFVFQNYIWVPIFSAIIVGIISLGTPKIILLIINCVKKRINKSVDEINISGEWNSFFMKKMKFKQNESY